MSSSGRSDHLMDDVVRVGPAVVRAFEAGPEGLEMVVVGGPKGDGPDGLGDDSPWPDEAA